MKKFKSKIKLNCVLRVKIDSGSWKTVTPQQMN